MRVTKLDKALQIIAALYNLPELPTSGVNYDRAIKLARKSIEVIDPQWRLANKMLLDRHINEIDGTTVCDGCGFRHPAESMQDCYDGTDTWKLCPDCMTPAEEEI